MTPSTNGAAGALAGRVAVVTGAGSRGPGIGNGRAAAILLARSGARVAILDRELRSAEETAQLMDPGAETLVLACDVSRPQDGEEAVQRVASAWGRIDILVNNVGVTGPAGSAETVDLAAWAEGLQTNVTSMMLMARYCIPRMRSAGAGAIVNVASLAGMLGGHPSLLYPTSKGAVIAMTRAMAAHHAADGIRVNCVAPGMVYTPMVASRGMDAAMRERRRLGSPLATEGTGWDVGHAVVFLASDAARWITGAVVPVDGGASAVISAPVPPSNGAPA
jgi:NAD(P)-dependent dehydrogenase (short-subunit alcohol dehydrogenase family)